MHPDVVGMSPKQIERQAPDRRPDRRSTSRKREVHQRSRAAWRCSPTCAPVRERPVPRLLGWLLRLIEQLQGPFTALPMIIYNWAGEAKAEFKPALAPRRHHCADGDHVPLQRRGGVPPESLRQAVVNAQLLLRADSR